MITKEIWKDIEGYEGLYQVSNLGNVKSLDREYIQWNNYTYTPKRYNGKILKPHLQRQGYVMINLSKNSKKKLALVHRLVAQAFIPNPNDYLEVNHKDGNKQNNCVDNLEWCNRKYNQKEAERLGLITRIKGEKNVHNKSVLRLNKNGEIIKEYYSITNGAEDIGVNMKHISYCIRKKRPDKITKSLWKYKEEK